MERLKAAIDKARQERSIAAQSAPAARPQPKGRASSFARLSLDAAQLALRRVVSHGKTDPAHSVFDVLRTRLLKQCVDKGWRRIGISSPGAGCGKTTVTANLAFSLARHPEAVALVVDLDLRAPALSRVLGVQGERRLARALSGDQDVAVALEQLTDRVTVALNDMSEKDAAELIQSETALHAIEEMSAHASADIVLFDLPPMLLGHDALGFLPHLDALLLIAAAGQTTADEVEECARQMEGQTNFLGVVLNKCTDYPVEKYEYGSAQA